MRRSALGIALREIRQHPLRTLLICQGMLWAVAIAIVPASVIEGSRERALSRAAELGTDRIEVTAEARGPETLMKSPDVPEVVSQIGDDAVVAGLRHASASLMAQPIRRAWVLAATPGIFEARGARFLAGGSFERREGGAGQGGVPQGGVPQIDVSQRDVPVVIERNLALSYLGIDPLNLPEQLNFEPAVGRPLWLERRARGPIRLHLSPPPHSLDALTPLRVVGVIDNPANQTVDRFGNEKGRLFARQMQELARAMGMMPPGTPFLESGYGLYLAEQHLPGDDIDWMFVRTDPSQVEDVSARIEEVLVARGRAPLLYQNSLLAILSQPELDGYRSLHDSLSRLYLGIGFIVLANLLLLSGWRRRREIALRRTEGASRGDIFWQFICEGCIIAFLGWLLGIAAGQLLAWIRVALDPNVLMGVGWPWSTMLEHGLWLGIGALITSAYPAWSASGNHPMTLFRSSYE